MDGTTERHEGWNNDWLILWIPFETKSYQHVPKCNAKMNGEGVGGN